MEPNHFSHNHGLVFHHLPQGSQVHCSGCNSPATGGVYTCRQGNYFLHQHCFGAPRSLNHPSHPLHPLSLMPFPTYPSRSFVCNSCNLVGYGFSYTCSQCEFDVHLHCSSLPVHNFNQQVYQPASARIDDRMRMARKRKEEEEAYVRKMEMEEKLRRRRQDLEMQRLQQYSDSFDRMNSII